MIEALENCLIGNLICYNIIEKNKIYHNYKISLNLWNKYCLFFERMLLIVCGSKNCLSEERRTLLKFSLIFYIYKKREFI